MVSENDKKIKSLLTAVEKKRKELGTKPKPAQKTNGILKFGSESVNVNTITSTDKCVQTAARLLQEKGLAEEACEFLGLPKSEIKHISGINDALIDLKSRTEIIVWESEKKKLQAMEARLKDLRSSDAKTEDALADISALLG